MDEKVIAGLVAFSAALCVAMVNLYWNFRSAKSARKLPFLNKQLDLCFEAVESAACLASSVQSSDWILAEKRFFELFWGPLAVVEDEDVARAMMRFAMLLNEANENALPARNLTGAALDLSAQVRKLLIKSWKIEDLNEVLEDVR